MGNLPPTSPVLLGMDESKLIPPPAGIGPENVLKESGVPIQLVNEHVGKNLADVSISNALMWLMLGA